MKQYIIDVKGIKSFKDVFGDNAEITLDHTFGELAEMQRLIMEQSQQQKESK